MGNGIRLRVGIHDRNSDSRYLGYCLCDETKIKTERIKDIFHETILSASCFFDVEERVYPDEEFYGEEGLFQRYKS
jgi:hypothetical protein